MAFDPEKVYLVTAHGALLCLVGNTNHQLSIMI